MPGLLRGVARTAAVAGTATAVSNRVSRRQGNRWAAQEPAQQDPYPQQGPAPGGPAQTGESRVQQLRDLGDLKQQGVLTDEEFAAEKSRILAS